MLKQDTETLRRWLIMALLLLVLMIVVVVFYQYYPAILGDLFSFLGIILFPFVFAWILCIFTRPMVRWLCRRLRLPQTLAVIVTLLICLGVLAGMITALVLVVVDLVGDLRVYFSNPQNGMMVLINQLQDLYQTLNMDFDQLQEWLGKIGEAASQLAGQGFTAAMDFARATPIAVLLVIVTIVASFYWCRDEDAIKRVLGTPFSPARRRVILESYDSISGVIGNYLRAQLLLMMIATVLCMGGLTILRIPNSVPMGLLAGVLDFIPVLGPGTILVPWSAWQLLSGNYGQGIGLLVVFLVLALVRNVVQPKILGDQMGLHPLATLASIFVGMKLFGVLGLVIGPIVLAVLMVLYRDLKARRQKAHNFPPPPSPPSLPPEA